MLRMSEYDMLKTIRGDLVSIAGMLRLIVILLIICCVVLVGTAAKLY
jgi:hypothetical protein